MQPIETRESREHSESHPPPRVKTDLAPVFLTLAALILLPACFGGGSQSCDAEFCGTSNTRTAAAPVTTPDPDPMTPGTGGNGGGPVTPPVTGGGGSMTPALTSEKLTSFPTPSTGGIARVADTQIDNTDAVLLIISETMIDMLQNSPAMTGLLSDNTTINYGAWDSANPQNAFGGTATMTSNVNARGGSNTKSGTLYALSSTSVYIDDHAPVVLGYASGGSNMEFISIGAPLSGIPTTMTATYSGLAAYAQKTLNQVISTNSVFEMEVNFGTSNISNFTATFGQDLTLTAANIRINPNGTFNSAAGGTVTARVGVRAIMQSGSLLGQFHGMDANGVTGAFHNDTNTFLGGFAGSKE